MFDLADDLLDDEWKTFIATFFVAIVLVIFFKSVGLAMEAISAGFPFVWVKRRSSPIPDVRIAYKYWNDTCTKKELLEKLQAVQKLAPNKTTIMIYYDDPLNFHTHKSRYAIGAILSRGSEPLTKDDTYAKLTSSSYQTCSMPKVNTVLMCNTYSIWRNNVSCSQRVAYEALNNYVKKHDEDAYPYLTVYAGFKTQYIRPIEKTQKFYVPEADPQKKKKKKNR